MATTIALFHVVVELADGTKDEVILRAFNSTRATGAVIAGLEQDGKVATNGISSRKVSASTAGKLQDQGVRSWASI